MESSFDRFGGASAMLVGVLSVAYAAFFLVVAGRTEFVGELTAWLILAASGFFTSATYVALYGRLRPFGEGYALWGLLLGVLASFATLLHGVYESLLTIGAPTAEGALLSGDLGDASLAGAIQAVRAVPSQVDPAGLATFFLVGVASAVFSALILRSRALPRPLGQLGQFNALLLVVLFLGSAAGSQPVILVAGGLTAVVTGPVWWIWLGAELRGQARPAPDSTAPGAVS